MADKTFDTLSLTEYKEEEVLNIAACKLDGASDVYAYAVLDHAVAFGQWESGAVVLGLGSCLSSLETLRHVQELRLFHRNGEFKAIRAGEQFRCRYRADESTVSGETTLRTMDEEHKLWGACRRGADDTGYSLLESRRGTRLYIPFALNMHEEAAVIVRHYIRMNRIRPGTGKALRHDEFVNPLQFVDERLVAFVKWKKGVKADAVY